MPICSRGWSPAWAAHSDARLSVTHADSRPVRRPAATVQATGFNGRTSGMPEVRRGDSSGVESRLISTDSAVEQLGRPRLKQ